jgi:cell division protein FtsB
MQHNKNKREIDRLNAEKDSIEYQVDEKDYKLNSPMDDEYIEDAARENGYCNPEDVIIYGDVMN